MRRERAKPKDALIETEVNGTEYYGLSNSIKTGKQIIFLSQRLCEHFLPHYPEAILWNFPFEAFHA